MFKLPSRRLGLATIVAAGVLVPVLAAYALPPFRGLRPNDAGTVTSEAIEYTSSPNNAWARFFNDAPNTLLQGTVRLLGTEWNHHYTQNHCPNGYTIIGNAVDIKERRWLLPFSTLNPLFIEHPTNPEVGQPNGTTNNRQQELITNRPQREITGVQFRQMNNTVVWQAAIISHDAYLVSTRRIRNNNGTTWRDAGTYDPRSATASHTINGTRSYVDICERAINQQCGDGTLDVSEGEECDDSNTVGGDGCNGACIIESCGNGYIEEMNGEECDDGNTYSGDGCSNTCVQEYCGDGVVQSALDEQCDDGNGESGDGCTLSCETESSSSSSDSSSSYSSSSSSETSSSQSSWSSSMSSSSSSEESSWSSSF